jgi:hypothetical protein
MEVPYLLYVPCVGWHRVIDLYHTRFLCQNRVLIVCMTQDQMFHTYGQKGSQKTKCHNIKYN